MEIGILAGLGLVGYYLNVNDQDIKNPTKTKVPSATIPNGKDIYNDARLREDEEKMQDLARDRFYKSMYPTETNIVPNYYNQLSSVLNKTRLKNSYRQPIDTESLYKIDTNLDDIYDDLDEHPETANSPNYIYEKPYIDRAQPLAVDVYDKYVKEHKKPPVKMPNVKRPYINSLTRAETVSRGPPKSIPEFKVDVVESFQNIPDNDLLAVSEQLTDNSDSLRRILTENVSAPKSTCKRMQTPEEDARKKRLIGVTGNLEKILIDDETAKYPYKGSSDPLIFRKDNPIFISDKEQPSVVANYPSYLNQFDLQTFDSEGLPSAPNDIYKTKDKNTLADLERNISLHEGWTEFNLGDNMAYGVVPERDLTHDNMIPEFSKKYGYGTNDLKNFHVMNYKNELFTGNLTSSWNKKQEVRPFFTPVADMSYVYGTPARPEEEESRMIPGRYYQNEKPFQEQRVTPGLNLAPNEIGTHGYHDFVRVFPKTTDEMRTADNPKVTYEGRIVEGMRGENGPVQAPVIKYRPDGFKITTEADLLPTNDVNTGPKTRDNFIMKETDRAEQQIEYTGGAYNKETTLQGNVPEYMRPKIKYATKVNFTLPKPLQKFAKDETVFNPNLVSYDTTPTVRATTGTSTQVGVAGDHSQLYSSLCDVAKTTTRQTVNYDGANHSNIVPNTMRGTVQYVDLAKPTIRQTTEDSLNPCAPSLNTQQRVYLSDVARPTISETTLQPVIPSNLSKDGTQIYANWSDIAKQTIKQTTVDIPYTTVITAVEQEQGSASTFNRDPLRDTIRQTTVSIPYQTVTTAVEQQQGSASTFNRTPLRDTIKQTTVEIPYNTNITPVEQEQGSASTFNRTPLRETVRQTTVSTPWNTNITPVEQEQGSASSFNRIPLRDTIRQTTVGIPYETFITAVDQQQGSASTFSRDPLRDTIKQTTVGIPYQTTVTPVDQQQGSASTFSRDPLRDTIKQTTVSIPYQTTVTGVDQQQGSASSFNRTPLRDTIKQTTVGIPYQTTVTPVDQQQGSASSFNRTPLRDTIKQTTVGIPYQTTVTGVDQQQGSASSFNRTPLRDTIKQTTVGIPYQTTVTGVDQQQGSASSFNRTPLRNTIKETTVTIPYNTTVTGVDQQQGSASTFSRTPLRNTIKQTTVGIPYNTTVTGVDQQQGSASSFNRTPLRNTVKETTVTIPYNTTVTAVDQQQGSASSFNRTPLRTTVRQTTEDEVYIPPMEGDPKTRVYNDAYNARIDDRKELLQVYRPPTTSNVDIGPIKEQMNVFLKNDDNKQPDPRTGYSVNNNLDRLADKGLTTSFQKDNVDVSFYTDSRVLRQLNANPYNIPYFGKTNNN